jgi:hypothetical protein
MKRTTTVWTAAIAALVLMVGGIGMTMYVRTQEVITITVTDKERVCTSRGETVSCDYRVYTPLETFVNKDSMLFTKFNSADVQGGLQPGESYEVRVVGWRIPFFSQFRNIVEVEP